MKVIYTDANNEGSYQSARPNNLNHVFTSITKTRLYNFDPLNPTFIE